MGPDMGRQPDHITTVLFKWVVFIALTALLLGGVAIALVAIWRWIF